MSRGTRSQNLSSARPVSQGNQAVQRLLRSGVIQTKLTVSQPGDAQEREADRVAEQIMRMPAPPARQIPAVSDQTRGTGIQRACTDCEEELQRTPSDERTSRDALAISRQTHRPAIQRLCTECEEELQRQPEPEGAEESLQAKETPGRTPEVTPEVQADINVVRRGGQRLPASIRAYFEPRFAHDFSHVRIHTDVRAAAMARAVRARAFTVGRDLVFGEGQYTPGTEGGRRLMAHELTHIIQQGSAARRSEAPGLVQRTIDDGHDLRSPRFSGDLVLEACYDDERYLLTGHRGEPVKKVQQALVDFGFPLPRFGVDGVFGSETRGAVKQFQTALGLIVDGIVGPQTIGALDTLPDPLPQCPTGVEPATLAAFGPPADAVATPNFLPVGGGCQPDCFPPPEAQKGIEPFCELKIVPLIRKGSNWDTPGKASEITDKIDSAKEFWRDLAGIDLNVDSPRVQSGIPSRSSARGRESLVASFGGTRRRIVVIFTDECCGFPLPEKPGSVRCLAGHTVSGHPPTIPAPCIAEAEGDGDKTTSYKEVLAHELGHAFLQTGDHFPGGLMEIAGRVKSLQPRLVCLAQWYCVFPNDPPEEDLCEDCD